MYQTKNLKTKQDYVDLLEEINAYRSIDGEDFDFGSGLIKNDMSYGSEDAYYEMDIQSLEETLEEIKQNQVLELRKDKQTKRNRMLHKREAMIREKKRMKELAKISWMSVQTMDDGVWQKRCYRGSQSKYLKKLGNKRVRRYQGELMPKSNQHKKVFDYWWIMY